MTLPTHIDDLEEQKFHDASGVPVVRVCGTTGQVLASQSTLAAASAKLPAALGQTTMANSLSVAVASDQSDMPLNVFGASGYVSPRKTFFIAQTVSNVFSSATDVFCIVGPSSGVAYVTHIMVTGTLNSAATVRISLVKRSTDNTGASSACTIVPAASADSTTVTAKYYTTAPSPLGTEVGVMDVFESYWPAPTGTRSNKYVWQVGPFNKPITLSAATDLLCVNMNGLNVTANIAFNAQFFHIV